MSVRRLLVMASLCLLVPAAPAAAQLESGSGLTAPGYPGNTLKVEPTDPLVAQTVQKVRLSGHAAWEEPTDATTFGYDVSLYVQDAAVDGTCAPWLGLQRQKSINLPGLSASASISGWVVDGDLGLNPNPPAMGLDWSSDSLPFSVRSGVREVLLCAYQRYIIDDVASYALAARVVPPSCKVAKRSIRRGGRMRLDCNLSGDLNVRFKRAGKSRTLKTTLSTKNGKGTLRTRSVKPGRYRVSFVSRDVAVEGATTVRIR